MRSRQPDDRTSRARIRDAALTQFGDRGPDAVTVRDVAAAAGVSPALVVRHYQSKDGLRTAVDEHVANAFEGILDQVVSADSASASLAEAVIRYLPPESPIPAYLGRMLVTGGPVGSPLFGRLFELSRSALDRMADVGTAEIGEDPQIRAAYLLVTDLAVLLLRTRLQEVIGVDPLSASGMERWGNEVLKIHRHGLGGRS